MRWSAIGLVVVAGCSFSTDVPGDGGGDEVSMTVDTDNDGLVDSMDNCYLIANPDQANHDGDPRGDLCDPCPHLMATTEADGDGDGVGDACDPRNGADSRALFEGFTGAMAISNWSRTGDASAMWSIMTGTAAQSNASTSDALLSAPMQYQRLSSSVTFRIMGLGTGASIGFCSGAVGVSTRYYCCTIMGGGTNLRASSSTDVAGLAVWPGTFAVGDTITITQSLVGSTNKCDAYQGTSTHVSASNGNVGATNGAFELYTAAAAAAFDYVFLVEIGS